jgi:hypothetical protein
MPAHLHGELEMDESRSTKPHGSEQKVGVYDSGKSRKTLSPMVIAAIVAAIILLLLIWWFMTGNGAT